MRHLGINPITGQGTFTLYFRLAHISESEFADHFRHSFDLVLQINMYTDLLNVIRDRVQCNTECQPFLLILFILRRSPF